MKRQNVDSVWWYRKKQPLISMVNSGVLAGIVKTRKRPTEGDPQIQVVLLKACKLRILFICKCGIIPGATGRAHTLEYELSKNSFLPG